MDLTDISHHEFHKSEVSVIKLSHDGNLVASGDSSKNIYIWSSTKKEIVNNRFVFHSAKVNDIAWFEDDTKLASASLDRSAIVWSIADKSRIKTFSDIDVENVIAVSFENDKEIIVGGHSCCLSKLKF